MVYYRSMRSLRAAISRKIKIFSFHDFGPLCGGIEIAHRQTEADIMQLLADIMQRVHEYTVRTAYSKSGEGLNITTIRVMQLSEVAGPIPPEFLTTNN